MNTFKSAALWSIILAIALKISGLVRESIIAKEFGASAETTGFYLAFSFITLVIAMIATGFNNVFLPMYIQRLKAGQTSDQNANGLLNLLMIIFVLISVLGWQYAEWFVPIIFLHMSEAVKPIAINITEVFFLFMTVIVLSSLLDSYLQSRRIFVPSQIAKFLATFFAAIFALLFSDTWGIYAVAYGFVNGTIIGVVIQIFFLAKSDYHWKPEISIEADFRKAFIILLIPSLLNSAVGQVNLLVNKSFASGTIDAAVTYLNNASMIVSIPNAIYASTLVTIIFTLMSEQVSNEQTFKNTFFRGMELSLITLLPIAIGMLIVGDSLISFIFERGKYSAEDTYQTYHALLWYTPTIVFQGMQLILSKSMYARGKTSIVFRISVTTIVLNFLLNWLLVDKFGYLALAFSASIVSAYYFIVSMIVVYKDLGVLELKRFFIMGWKIVISSTIMGLILFTIKMLLPFNGMITLLQLILLTAIGVVIYTLSLKVFYPVGFTRITELKKSK